MPGDSNPEVKVGNSRAAGAGDNFLRDRDKEKARVPVAPVLIAMERYVLRYCGITLGIGGYIAAIPPNAL